LKRGEVWNGSRRGYKSCRGTTSEVGLRNPVAEKKKEGRAKRKRGGWGIGREQREPPCSGEKTVYWMVLGVMQTASTTGEKKKTQRARVNLERKLLTAEGTRKIVVERQA